MIKLTNFSFKYSKLDKYFTLKDVNFEVNKGDFIAVIGPNGGGKTTLIKAILGLIKIKIGKIEMHINRSEIGYTEQHDILDKQFPITVKEVVLTGTLNNKSFFPFYSKKQKDAAYKTMKLVGIEKLENKKVGDLSGGQRQRVRIARALVSSPKLLILDEPTASIDHNTEKEFYDFLKKLNKEKNITIILVSHDIGAVSKFTNKILCVNQSAHLSDSNSHKDSHAKEVYNAEISVVHHNCKI